MSQKRIENKFRSALKDYSSIIDEDQLWLEIEDSIPKKKKKRRLLIWFFSGVSIMALGVLFFWLMPDSKLSSQSNKIEDVQIESSIAEKVTMSKLPELETISQDQKSGNNIKPNDIINKESEINAFANNFLQYNKTTADSHKVDQEIKIQKRSNNIENTQDRNEIRVPRVNTIPLISELLRLQKDNEIEIQTKKRRTARPKKTTNNVRSNFMLNYYAGNVFSKKELSTVETRYINFGEDYFSQGLSLSYNRFFGSKLYGRVILSIDKSYKKYASRVTRDTLVPSSLGSQILSYTKYGNGIIDTESGIPIVEGVYSRDVLNLNTMTSILVGLGLGYEQSIGNWNINLEADVQRSFYYSLSGLGQVEGIEQIRELDSFDNYFSNESKYVVNTQMNLGFEIIKSINLAIGLQYQLGLSSMLTEDTKHVEKHNLLRGSIGLKKEF